MQISNSPIEPILHKRLKDYCYDIIACMHYVHDNLGPGLPEYIYQEALTIRLRMSGYEKTEKEYRHFPIFDGIQLQSFVKMDLMVPLERGNIVIECKSLTQLSDKERFQTFGYLRATEFPIAILVNFGTWPKAQIERYYFDRHSKVVRAF